LRCPQKKLSSKAYGVYRFWRISGRVIQKGKSKDRFQGSGKAKTAKKKLQKQKAEKQKLKNKSGETSKKTIATLVFWEGPQKSGRGAKK